MKNTSTRRGFTLIELLVVVLIIGILAAVAVPQYQKVVEKSRATQALTLLKSAYQAQKAYYLANGDYPTSFNELDVDIPWSGNEKWFTGNTAKDTRSNEDWSIQLLKGKSAGLLMGRISGPYQGVGFAVYLNSANAPNGTIVCFERKAEGIIFDNEEDGAYCKKILNGTKMPEASSTHNIYTLPY